MSKLLSKFKTTPKSTIQTPESAGATVYQVSDPSEFREDNLIEDPNTVVFILFYNSKDKASKEAVQFVEGLANDLDYAGVKFHMNDLNESDELADEYHVKQTPACLFLRQGKVFDKVMSLDEGLIRRKLRKNPGETPDAMIGL